MTERSQMLLSRSKMIRKALEGGYDSFRIYPIEGYQDGDAELRVYEAGANAGDIVFGYIRYYKDIQWFRVKIMDLKKASRPYFQIDGVMYYLDLLQEA